MFATIHVPYFSYQTFTHNACQISTFTMSKPLCITPRVIFLFSRFNGNGTKMTEDGNKKNDESLVPLLLISDFSRLVGFLHYMAAIVFAYTPLWQSFVSFLLTTTTFVGGGCLSLTSEFYCSTVFSRSFLSRATSFHHSTDVLQVRFENHHSGMSVWAGNSHKT